MIQDRGRSWPATSPPIPLLKEREGLTGVASQSSPFSFQEKGIGVEVAGRGRRSKRDLPPRSRPGTGRLLGELQLDRLRVVQPETPRLVVGERGRTVERAGVDPDTGSAHRPGA